MGLSQMGGEGDIDVVTPCDNHHDLLPFLLGLGAHRLRESKWSTE